MKPGIKFLRSIFEVAHVEFQTYDLSNHKLLFSSGLTHQLLGYSKEEYEDLSRDFYKNVIDPADSHIVEQAMDKIKHSKKGDVIEMTVRARKKDGDYIWAYSRQMIYERNDPKGICVIIREVEDVTDLVELQDKLEEKVGQLKIVSYKNSHLLRSPVASIIGLVDLIEEHAITGDHNKQVLDFLKEAITKLDAVIREINDAARID
ncbi:MAG TPA: PAS domain S-box protein [Mucilaginibacter sp.]|jgi:PAS domain S-box-containing protein|nr:PAS domain S-box protein [Mucilaginibacter sp.]